MKRKLLSIAVTLCMVMTLFISLGAVASAEELSLTYMGADGEEYLITESDIAEVAGEEQTFSIDKVTTTEEVTAQFALLTDVLDYVGAPEASCGYDIGGVPIRASQEIYLYVSDQGLRSAVDGSQGFMWQYGLTSIKAIEHNFEDHVCTNEFEIQRKPSKVTESCGERSLTYTATDGNTYEITESDIVNAAGEEQTFTIDKVSTTEEVTAEFALLADVLYMADAPEAECGYDIGGVPIQASQEIYLYVTEDQGIRSAVDGSQGFMWQYGLTSITGIDHAYDENHECTNEYDIKRKPSKETVTCGHQLQCMYYDMNSKGYVITAQDIMDRGEEKTMQMVNKQGNGNDQGPYVFAKLSDLIEAVGAKEADCGYWVWSINDDSQKYKASLEMYLFITEENQIRTAVDGGQGFMWFTGVSSIEAYGHDLKTSGDYKVCTNEYLAWRYADDSEDYETCSYKEKIPTTAIYRLYNPKTKEHLWTPSANEYKTLKKYGWNQEGIAWYAPKTGSAVYRLYNPKSKDHHYTASKNEAKTLTSKYGWKYDNNGKALFYSGGSKPIYRLYNKSFKQGSHHLTGNVNEYKTLPKYGWKQEGVAMKCFKLK